MLVNGGGLVTVLGDVVGGGSDGRVVAAVLVDSVVGGGSEVGGVF